MTSAVVYGELGCYGQEKIRTPHIDRLAAEGMRFTQHYSGAPVCAPSRCVLMTGRHSGHAEVRGNREVKPEGQHPISAECPTLPGILRDAGYVTGAMGKWGLGPVGSTGDPNAKGFDLFFGYNCQREAHTYYPQHLWLNREKLPAGQPGGARVTGGSRRRMQGYARFYGNEYAPDLMLARAKAFLRARAADAEPFFLYLPFVEPHVAMQPPQDHVARYPEEWDQQPYLGGRGYVPASASTRRLRGDDQRPGRARGGGGRSAGRAGAGCEHPGDVLVGQRADPRCRRRRHRLLRARPGRCAAGRAASTRAACGCR
jgi:arylsulfatase A